MKTLYFDCFSGISGDMTLGALIDIGADEKKLIAALEQLNIEGYEIRTEKKLKNSIAGTDLTVILEADEHELDHNHDHEHPHGNSHMHMHDHGDGHMHEHVHTHEAHEEEHEHTHEHRNYADILKIIDGSSLNDNVKLMSKNIFKVVAEAEGKIHGKPAEQVHFHEVGAVDSIVDIIGTAICIDMLGIDRVAFSRLPLSHGFVKCQHGLIPLPAPATLEILKDVPVYYNDAGFELVTPTGAAIVKALGSSFGKAVDGKTVKVGYGLGKKTYEIPNVLRVMLIEEASAAKDSVIMLETNIDDMTGEQLGYVLGKLLDAGALDAYFTNIYMKKNRPAVKLSVLCGIDKKDEITDLILRETSTFGVRYCNMDRSILDREMVKVATPYGEVDCKLGKLDGKIIKYSPEYEDCRRIAEQSGKNLREVYNEIMSAARSSLQHR